MSRKLLFNNQKLIKQRQLPQNPSSSCSYNDKFGDEAENEDLIETKLETQFSFRSNSMRVIVEDNEEDGEKERALNRFEDRGESGPSNFDRDGDLDNYYRKLLQENPSDPLALKNYAHYLESKRNFSGAEEYYYLATLADPKDGEILSQYAKLVWEMHGNQAKASDYFERAVQSAPGNSNVLAAYASFMWRTNDGSDEDENWSNNTQADEDSVTVDISSKDFKDEKRPSSPPLHLAKGLGIDGYDIDYISTHSGESNSLQEYYRRMVEENPRDPSSLRKYALFLHQSKGDLNGAEEYYSRAILEDPNHGQMLSAYAGILWQIHGNKDRAVAYFERAILATPEDSDVLAAYAKFLWETDAGEDEVQF